MAYNKAKAIEDAQKLFAAGKLKEAVAEFKKIHTREPKDQNVLNALGDLYARLNSIPDALEYYIKLADMYASDGFLVRGIAMYKKITKLAAANLHALERLADLYAMQGMVGDARAQYLQVVEASLKANNAPKAMEALQKVLDLDPDNLKIQKRLAELYERHRQAPQAAGIYRRLAERAFTEGHAADGEQWLKKASELAPDNVEVLLLRARAQQEAGRAAESLATLKSIPNVEEHAEASDLLLAAHLAAGNAIVAEELAEKLFAADPSRFSGLLRLGVYAAREKDSARAVGYLERVLEPALQHDPLQLVESLRQAVSLIPDSPEALELMARAARKAQHQPALLEALSRQAQLAAKQEDYARAKELYNELVSLEPQNPEFTQRLNKMRQQLGETVTPAEAAEFEAAAFEMPLAEIELDEDTKAYVNSTLTDMDLFSSYGMADKAIELALGLIARVPNHLVGHEKLLDFYLGTGNDAGVAEIASRLEPLYRQQGNRQRADEVMSLASRYAEKAGIAVPGAAAAPEPAAAAPPAEPTFEIPMEAPTEPVAEIPAAAPTHEVDLSAEWASVTAGAEAPVEEFPVESLEAAPPAFNVTEASEEIDFYLAQGLLDQAREALARYEAAFPGEPALLELSTRIEAAAAPAEELPAVEEPVMEVPLAEEPAGEVAEILFEPTPAEAPAEELAVEEPAAFEPAPAVEEGDTYEVVLEEPAKEAAPAGAPMSAGDFFSDLAGELDQVLEGGPAAPPPAQKAAPPRAARPAPPPPAKEETPVGVLSEVFEEFKEEMGGVEEDVDVESHYNLGIAYKEMGLLDEAISEFQKVTKAAEKLKAHGQYFQACTLLGLCFMDKGHPQIAVRWYERALKTPGVDEEGQLALRYDMGVAHEQAGNRKAALDCFLEVYGANVDYRDVSERLRELKGA